MVDKHLCLLLAKCIVNVKRKNEFNYRQSLIVNGNRFYLSFMNGYMGYSALDGDREKQGGMLLNSLKPDIHDIGQIDEAKRAFF